MRYRALQGKGEQDERFREPVVGWFEGPSFIESASTAGLLRSEEVAACSVCSTLVEIGMLTAWFCGLPAGTLAMG